MKGSSENASQTQDSSISNASPGQKSQKKLDVLTKILIWCYLFLFAIFIFGILFSYAGLDIESKLLGTVIGVSFLVAFVAAPFLAIASLTGISLNSARHSLRCLRRSSAALFVQRFYCPKLNETIVPERN